MHAETQAGFCPFLFMATRAGTPARDNEAMSNLSLSNQVDDLMPPARVHPTVSMEKKPIPGLTSRLMKRLVLLDQVLQGVDQALVRPAWEGSQQLCTWRLFG
jgi:hypothetical protein